MARGHNAGFSTGRGDCSVRACRAADEATVTKLLARKERKPPITAQDAAPTTILEKVSRSQLARINRSVPTAAPNNAPVAHTIGTIRLKRVFSRSRVGGAYRSWACAEPQASLSGIRDRELRLAVVPHAVASTWPAISTASHATAIPDSPPKRASTAMITAAAAVDPSKWRTLNWKAGPEASPASASSPVHHAFLTGTVSPSSWRGPNAISPATTPSLPCATSLGEAHWCSSAPDPPPASANARRAAGPQPCAIEIASESVMRNLRLARLPHGPSWQ